MTAPLQYSCLENPNDSMKRQKGMLEEEPLRSEGVQYATVEEQRIITSSSSKNGMAAPKQKQCSPVHVFGGESKVLCSKEQYCIGTWNVRSVNQGKLDVVKQEMARWNIDILGISELKLLGMGKLTQMTIISTIMGKNSLEEIE